ncbi:MAG: hypothetical protein J0M15_16590 [Deltaproteobacteria bacterium]|nr:hypothetical protein [Deltaproteobacteria bacterium]
MDNVAIRKVELFLNSTLISTMTVSPYSTNLDTTLYPDGVVTFKAIAKDTSGNPAHASLNVTMGNIVDTIAPIITSFSPANGSIVSGRAVAVPAAAAATSFNSDPSS